MRGQEPPLATQTLPQCTVYHTLQADLKSMMNNIQTREQLDDFREHLDAQARCDTLQDPPTVARKGRPLSKRLTGATEGRPQGGGGTSNRSANAPRRPNCCSRCHKPGHNRSSCPWEA
ncbi:hypothetical protein B0H13DRAFT_1605363 [Mycena leptocephala]|nr:hypothetical protein B0H13DRAFT_1605363 [Mycena leptocephala]